jgi:hypothetical protein
MKTVATQTVSIIQVNARQRKEKTPQLEQVERVVVAHALHDVVVDVPQEVQVETAELPQEAHVDTELLPNCKQVAIYPPLLETGVSVRGRFR